MFTSDFHPLLPKRSKSLINSDIFTIAKMINNLHHFVTSTIIEISKLASNIQISLFRKSEKLLVLKFFLITTLRQLS